MNTVKQRQECPHVAFLGDMHIGRIDCDLEAFQKTIDFLSKGQIPWVGMGDYVEGRIPSHKFYEPYETTEMVQEQYDTFFRMIEPISHLCIGLLIGNHEDSMIRVTTINPIKQYCNAKNITYFGSLGRIEFYEGQKTTNPIVIYVTHGDGGGHKAGGKINKIIDWVSHRNCDGLAVGHFHTLGSWVEVSEGESPNKRKYKNVMICGTYMDSMHPTSESYAVRKMMSPIPLGYMMASLNYGGANRLIPTPYYM